MTRLTLFAALLTPMPALAGGILLQAEGESAHGDLITPTVLVGVQPQAKATPRTLSADVTHPPEPGIVLDGLEEGTIDMLIGVGGVEVERIVLPGEACGLRTDTEVWPLTDSVEFPAGCTASFVLRATLTDGTELDLEVTSERGYASPASIVGFNPQPEPPGLPASLHLAVSFDDKTETSAHLLVTLVDGLGTQLDLQ